MMNFYLRLAIFFAFSLIACQPIDQEIDGALDGQQVAADIKPVELDGPTVTEDIKPVDQSHLESDPKLDGRNSDSGLEEDPSLNQLDGRKSHELVKEVHQSKVTKVPKILTTTEIPPPIITPPKEYRKEIKVSMVTDGKPLDVQLPKSKVLGLFLNSPQLSKSNLAELAPPPKFDVQSILQAAAKNKKGPIEAVVDGKKTIATKMLAVPKAIGMFLLKKPLLLLAKKKALAGGALALVGKKVMLVGAKIGLVGAKTAAAGATITGLSLKGMKALGFPGIATLAAKGANYLPGISFVDGDGLTTGLTTGLTSVVSSPYVNWLWNPEDSEGKKYLVNSPFLDIVTETQQSN